MLVDRIFRSGDHELELLGRDPRISDMYRTNCSPGPLAQQLNRGNASVTGRDRKIGKLAVEGSARRRCKTSKRSAQQVRTKMAPAIVGQLLSLEREADRLGEGKNLVIVALVSAEKRPDFRSRRRAHDVPHGLDRELGRRRDG